MQVIPKKGKSFATPSIRGDLHNVLGRLAEGFPFWHLCLVTSTLHISPHPIVGQSQLVRSNSNYWSVAFVNIEHLVG